MKLIAPRRIASLTAIAFLSCALLPSVVGVSHAGEPLKLNKDKSKLGFVGYKPDDKHVGGFKTFDVTAEADHEDMSNSKLKIEIKTASLWSDADKLTAHLKNPDFFDVRKYPTAVFEATKFEPLEGEGEVMLHGKLTMLGTTEEIKAPAKISMTDSEIKLVAKFKVDRMKWGMTYGKGKINDEVDINADLVFNR